MRIISNILGERELIEKAIAKNFNTVEHHYFYYIYKNEGEEDLFFSFDNDSGILARHDQTNTWYMFSEVLAPEERKLELFLEFLKHVLNEKNGQKLTVEVSPDFRKKLLKELKNSDFKVCNINYALTWPVFDMKNWDGHKMEGKKWKDLRYYWNRFFREHKVEFKNAGEVSKEELKKLVYEWKKERNPTDRAYCEYFINAIENEFKGFDMTRVLIVNGEPCALTAGFKLPNSTYYSSIGIYNRKHDRTGEIANMDDLIQLKNSGYEYVDFGGGEEALTEFKKKFQPHSFYKTLIFSIVKKKESVKVKAER